MTLGELADRAVARVASQWAGLLIIIVLWTMPGTAIGLAVGTAMGHRFGQFVNLVLGILLVPTSIGLLARVVTNPFAALRWGVGHLALSVRCGILSAVTYGIAAAIVNRMAAGARVDGYAVMVAVFVGGYVLIAPLFLVSGLMYVDAMLRTGRATNAFSTAWSRGFRADPRRSWFLGSVVSLAIFVVAALFATAAGLADRFFGTVYVLQSVVTTLTVPAASVAQMAFCVALDEDLRLRYAGDDLEALIDAPTEIEPGVSTSQ